MVKKIIAEVSGKNEYAAVTEDGKLTEFYIESSDAERLVGNIYVGKIVNIIKSMDSAFIDIGIGQNAFLFLGDVVDSHNPALREQLKPGQGIMVQVIKDARGDKGPRVTTNISIPGRYVVLLPKVDYIGVSRKIEDEAEREKLRQMLNSVKRERFGLIARTLTQDMDRQHFENDVEFLMKVWENINDEATKATKPGCIYKDQNLMHRVVRDIFSREYERFVVNDRETYDYLLSITKTLDPILCEKISLYEDDAYDIFSFYNIKSQIRRAFSRKIWLDCGGYIVIDRTEALTVIDVNTGKYTGGTSFEQAVLKTNLEAMEEIAKQIRLRDIGGIIVVDAIDMTNKEHREKMLSHLREQLDRDRVKTTLVGVTGLGLIEITRKKTGKSIDEQIFSICDKCQGTGKISQELVDRLLG